jgi:hypothetical protein
MNRRVVARASRPCEYADRHTGETPVPLAFAPGRRSALLLRVSWSQRLRKKRMDEPHFANPNDETSACAAENLSTFGLRISFVIRYSSFSDP